MEAKFAQLCVCVWVCQRVREVFQCTPCHASPCPISVPLTCCHSATVVVYLIQVLAAVVSLTSADPEWDGLCLCMTSDLSGPGTCSPAPVRRFVKREIGEEKNPQKPSSLLVCEGVRPLSSSFEGPEAVS